MFVSPKLSHNQIDKCTSIFSGMFTSQCYGIPCETVQVDENRESYSCKYRHHTIHCYTAYARS